MALSDQPLDSCDAERVSSLAAVPGWGGSFVKLQLTVLDAANAHAQTTHYYQRQQACYQRFRSEAAVEPHKRQKSWTGVRLIAAYDQAEGGLCGGVGVYERMDGVPLPVELALGPTPALISAFNRWRGQRIFEVSGLWVEERWRRTGLSTQLMLVAMATATFYSADKIVGFSHQHVLDFYGTIGLIPDRTVGTYNYPDEKYVSTFIWADPPTLTTAPEAARAQIFRLAEQLRRGDMIRWVAPPPRTCADQALKENTDSSERRSERVGGGSV